MKIHLPLESNYASRGQKHSWSACFKAFFFFFLHSCYSELQLHQRALFKMWQAHRGHLYGNCLPSLPRESSPSENELEDRYCRRIFLGVWPEKTDNWEDVKSLPPPRSPDLVIYPASFTFFTQPSSWQLYSVFLDPDLKPPEKPYFVLFSAKIRDPF